ncbi:MAG: hypothetical protein ACLQUY_05165 [Ktedonobacterales bacterium]
MSLFKHVRVALVVLVATAGILVTSTAIAGAAPLNTRLTSHSTAVQTINLAQVVRSNPSAVPNAKPSPAAIATAEAYLAQHPIQGYIIFRDKNGNVVYPTMPSGATSDSTSGVKPDASIGFGFDSITLYLTNSDVENIWYLVLTTGVSAAGALLCAEGGPIAIACGIVGAVIGYVVASVVWNYINWNCGLAITWYLIPSTWSVQNWACK